MTHFKRTKIALLTIALLAGVMLVQPQVAHASEAQEKAYADVYDFVYYRDNNPDVNAAYNGNRDEIFNHFLTYGINEGRQAIATFDVRSYYNEYQDLRVAFRWDLKQYYLHYIQYGKKEGRHTAGCTTLRDYYRNAYGRDFSACYDGAHYYESFSDLQNAYTRNGYIDDVGLFNHFLDYGIHEGREGKASFNVRSYYNANPDLRAIYHWSLGDYYWHYVDNGAREGRTATGASSIQGLRTSINGVDYSAVYNGSYYYNSHADLQNVYTWNGFIEDTWLLQHFIDCGMPEGRQAADNFNVTSYKNRYWDLRAAFGSYLPNYYYHYINYGRAEGRIATGNAVSSDIMGINQVSASELANLYINSVGEAAYPSSVYSSKGASTIYEFAQIVFEESAAEGVRAEIVFCQEMLETGWLKFGGDVKAEQCNFAGIGATGGGAHGATFANVREGVRAQVQHLKAYASTEPLNNPCVDPRFSLVTRGCATCLEQLDGRWATGGNYGERIMVIVRQLFA